MRAEYLLTLSFAEGKLRLRTVTGLARGISIESDWGLGGPRKVRTMWPLLFTVFRKILLKSPGPEMYLPLLVGPGVSALHILGGGSQKIPLAMSQESSF